VVVVVVVVVVDPLLDDPFEQPLNTTAGVASNASTAAAGLIMIASYPAGADAKLGILRVCEWYADAGEVLRHGHETVPIRTAMITTVSIVTSVTSAHC
jgi:hypothetical protein